MEDTMLGALLCGSAVADSRFFKAAIAPVAETDDALCPKAASTVAKNAATIIGKERPAGMGVEAIQVNFSSFTG